MSFSYAQTFVIDPDTVTKAKKVNITKVMLYFRAKPRAVNNKSGIEDPGVQVGIVPCQFGIPVIGQLGLQTDITWARTEYGAIHPTPDAALGTTFYFGSPQSVETGKEYAIVVKFDGNEDFLLWINKTGDNLIGTNNKSPGSSGRFVGKLFSYVTPDGTQVGTGVGYSDSQDANSAFLPSTSTQNFTDVVLTQEYLLSAWKPLDDSDLKFEIAVARYAFNGQSVVANSVITSNRTYRIRGNVNTSVQYISNNVIQITSPTTPVEFVSYNRATSNTTKLSFGDVVYQKQPYWSGGKPTPATCSVTNTEFMVVANNSYVMANGSNFVWSDLISNSGSGPHNIVITSLDHFGANQHAICVRTINEVQDDVLILDRTLTFTNSAAYFYISPVGRVKSLARTLSSTGKYMDLLTLSDSNANSSVRFVNNAVNSYSIVDDGTGYSNDEYLVVSGYEEVTAELTGGYSAYANIVTDASGNITSLYFTNNGCGFVNTDAVVLTFANSTGGTANGTGANIALTYNTNLITEFGNGSIYFAQPEIINLDASQLQPILDLSFTTGVSYGITHRTLFYSEVTANTISGKRYYINNDSSLTDMIVRNGKIHNFDANSNPCIVSRSNQWVTTFANGILGNSDVVGQYNSNVAIYLVQITSNNDFTALSFGNVAFSTVYAKYVINNDYTNEHTNYGNAYAKHVSTKVNFADGRKAEDLLVYLTAFRPPNTDFKVYARIHNSLDAESFDLKDWTLLEQTDGLNVYSNPENQADMKEFTYNFSAYPNTSILTGTVSTTLSSNSITGSNTEFDTDLAVNDIVKIYQPLFPNNYLIGVVGTIGSNVSITLNEPVSNNGMVGDGLKIEKVDYPKQGFNEILNSNVATYYNSSLNKFEGFDSMQIKVIFLSPNDKIVPKIDDVRAVATTA